MTGDTANPAGIEARLGFVRAAQQLKDTLRSAHTAAGRTESVAEHSWRLALMAMTFADCYPDVDLLRLLKICIIHDLGEALNGDIPAPLQADTGSKSCDERADFLSLIAALPEQSQCEFRDLWDDYERAASPEARLAKALDKIETILQHNQGANPNDFDFAFNLEYGRQYTDALPLTAKLRAILDDETRKNCNG